MPLSDTVLILMGLLTVAMLAAGVFRNLPVPYTVILVVIGMGLAELSTTWAPLAPLEEFRLSPELVFFVFLPALIFEAGFNLDARELLKELPPVLVLAVPALLISTTLVGLGVSLILRVDLITALLFGALISATDPVAVIALFKELGAPQRLGVLVEGESLLNDATAIVVFTILLGMAVGGAQLSWSDSGTVAGEFLRVFIGGALLGALLGVVVSEVLYRLHLPLAAILTMSVVLAYASFIVAEHVLHISGVMAAAAAAVALAAFGMPRLRHEATVATGELWEVLALICNSLLFLLVGLSVDIGALGGAIFAIVVAIVLVLVSRAAAVYSLVPATTRLFSLPHISMGERHIMWWGGLKGGLAIAIVLSIPEDLPGRQLLLNMTLGVVIFTLLVNAPTIRPSMSKLGLDRLTNEERAELKHALLNAQHEGKRVLERFRATALISDETRREVETTSATTFAAEVLAIEGDRQARDVYLASMRALRTELEELTYLYDIGVISQILYLDMRNVLQRYREAHSSEESGLSISEDREGVFLRLETALLRRMREQDWAAGLFTRYQNLRLEQRLQRDIAGILMCEGVLQMLRGHEEGEVEPPEPVVAAYEKRSARFRDRVDAVRTAFPSFYKRFESRLCTRVLLAGAMRNARREHHHGEIGAKAFVIMERRVEAALEDLLPLAGPLSVITARDLKETVPLLGELSRSELEALSACARPITFLPGDVIIGEREKGDAFYIITHGEVSVYKKSDDGVEILVAELGQGEFLGESSLIYARLLGHVRTATLRARTPCTLLRFPRRDINAILDRNPDLKARLGDLHRTRTAPKAPTSG